MAGKPVIQTIPVDFVDTIDCGGFALEGHVFGTVKTRLTEYPDGSARDISSIRLRHVVTNPQTGESLTSNDVGVDKVSIHPDGSFTLMQVGLISRYRIPGQGLIAHEGADDVCHRRTAVLTTRSKAGPPSAVPAVPCERDPLRTRKRASRRLAAERRPRPPLVPCGGPSHATETTAFARKE